MLYIYYMSNCSFNMEKELDGKIKELNAIFDEFKLIIKTIIYKKNSNGKNFYKGIATCYSKNWQSLVIHRKYYMKHILKIRNVYPITTENTTLMICTLKFIYDNKIYIKSKVCIFNYTESKIIIADVFTQKEKYVYYVYDNNHIREINFETFIYQYQLYLMTNK